MPLYSAEESMVEHSNNSRYFLHTHQEYEIFMFLEGDSEYVIEEKTYPLESGDIIIIRKNKMHRIFHNSSSRYHRICLMISPDFFAEKNCPEYEDVFINAPDDRGSKIDARIAHESGLYDAINRLKKYSDNFKNLYTPLCDAVVTEILYIINKAVSFSAPKQANHHINKVISHINSAFTQKITLDELSEKFFISKYHLCRLFKQATGLTIHDYIKNKRVALAEDLISKGYNMTEAAARSGFNDYAAFYRAKKAKISEK